MTKELIVPSIPTVATYKVKQQDHKLYLRLDNKFVDEAERAFPSIHSANLVRA